MVEIGCGAVLDCSSLDIVLGFVFDYLVSVNTALLEPEHWLHLLYIFALLPHYLHYTAILTPKVVAATKYVSC